MKGKYFILLFMLIITSCVYEIKEDNDTMVDPDEYKRTMENVNILMSKSEDDQISDYIKRYGWKVTKTGTGLRYLIYQSGTGTKVTENSKVKYNYRTELINGFVCYNSVVDGPKEVTIGQTEMPPGLEEGLKLMREGDKSKLILPSHLGYGLLGDQNKIPAKAILIYHIDILEVK